MGVTMAQRPHYVAETQLIHRVVASPRCSWRFVKHAIEMMAYRGISQPDIANALTKGQVTLREPKQDILYRVAGRDLDGNPIDVIVSVVEEPPSIKVVTVFEVRK
jgi:hypothetical protein